MAELANDEYGKLFHANVVIDRDHRLRRAESRYVVLTIYSLMVEIMRRCGYKYGYGELTHSFGERILNEYNGQVLDEIDLSNHTFSNGKHISHYFERLKRRKNYTDGMIEALKKELKVKIMVVEMAKTKQKMRNALDKATKKMTSKL